MTNGENQHRNSNNANSSSSNLRSLPSVDRLLHESNATDLIENYGREQVRDALRIVLDAAREWIRQGGLPPDHAEFFHTAAEVLNKQFTPSLRPVINATGVILHTNLGRAPLSEAAQEAMLTVASGYSTLEYQLETGQRGKRDAHIEELVKAVTGAEAALVVNNNAAAIMLILAAFASEREVIISRGQLVEIGGGFRVPEIMNRSGAKLVEVGTTNRTNIEDYAEAITPQSTILLRAHASNFRQIGFTSQPGLSEIAKLAHKNNLLAIDDLGSGALLNTAQYGLVHEPTVQESIAAGCDLVSFSGDKLLGGPQAGIVVGKKERVAALKKHPLARTVRIDKLRLAALVATLTHYRTGSAATHIPIWRMIAMPIEQIRQRTEAWAAELSGDVEDGQLQIIASKSTIGGGSLPGETLPTYALALTVSDPNDFAARLRRQTQALPVIARVREDRVLLDPRTVLLGQDTEIIRALRSALGLSVL